MILTVEEVKSHLRIEDNDEDALIGRLIAQAQATAENFCRVTFGGTTTDDEGNEVEVEVPEPVKLAVMLMVSHYFENRDNPEKTIYTTMRMAFENLLYPYRDEEKMF